MANIKAERARCMTLVNGQNESRTWNYDANTPIVSGDPHRLNIADAKLTATWNTATDSGFRKGDLIQVACTDGILLVQVSSVNSSTGVPTVKFLEPSPTS